MGEVWKAVDTTLERSVAVKILPRLSPKTPSGSPGSSARRSFSLPSIIQHRRHPWNPPGGGGPFPGDELAAGEDLARRIQRGALSVEDALAVGRQVAEALEAPTRAA